MSRLLMVSNGAGEDAIAMRVAAHLEGYSLHALPVVGHGSAYREPVVVVGPRRRFSSQGLILESLGRLLQDLREGLVLHHLRQLWFLRQQRDRYRLFVAVGDLFPVILLGLAGLKPVVFIGTAKSVYHHAYSWLELRLLRFWTQLCLTRDEPTAEQLRRAELAARWVGNAMMDELVMAGVELPGDPELPGLTLFPGSREPAYRDFAFQVQVVEELFAAGFAVQAMVALAPAIDPERLAQSCPRYRFRLTEGPVVGSLEREGRPPILFCRGILGDLLERSEVAFGQAGTANEQAAGAGVPVVACEPGGETGLGWYRSRQKGLLGEALRVVKPADAAAELRELYRNSIERKRRGEIGRERMGPPGGAARMAAELERLLKS